MSSSPRAVADNGVELRPRFAAPCQGTPVLGKKLRRLLSACIRAITRQTDTKMAAICLLRGDYLFNVISSGLPREYVRAVARTPLGVGCCGIAVAEARPVVVENIPCSRDMSAFRCLCEENGLGAVWCIPLVASDTSVLGGLAIYHHRPFKPSLDDMREVETFAEIIAAAVELSHPAGPADAHRRESRQMATRFLDVQESDRRRIAEELHDELIQDLVGLQLALEAGPGDSEAIVSISPTLGRLIARLRELIFELRPLTLETEGLAQTAALMLARLREQTGIETRLISDLTARLSPRCEQLAYRVVREGLQNIRKHSSAKAASLELSIRNATDLEVWLNDDGMGFVPETEMGVDHFGLASMKHQVESVGGGLEIVSMPGRGTTLRAVIPAVLT